MSSHLRIVFACTLLICSAALPLACAAAGGARAPNERMPGVAEASGAPTASTAAASATAPTTATPVVSAAETSAPTPPPSAEPSPPCIDGEIMMGTCICDKGKTADATGHCVYPSCPKSTTGGTPFRDEATGQCMECRAGLKPTKDGRCER